MKYIASVTYKDSVKSDLFLVKAKDGVSLVKKILDSIKDVNIDLEKILRIEYSTITKGMWSKKYQPYWVVLDSLWGGNFNKIWRELNGKQ